MKFLNNFCTVSAREKHFECCSSNGYVKVNMPSKNEKQLKFHEEQYQFKVLFILYTEFEIFYSQLVSSIERR